MSKRKARQQQVAAAAQLATRKKRRIFVVIALLLCLGLSGGIFAQWRATRIAGMNALLFPAQSVPAASNPSKEYIYAGGRLIATQEPTAVPSSSPTPAPTPPPPVSSAGGTNVALAINGGVATASSTTPNEPYPGHNFNPSVAIDGDRKNGYNFWRDDTDIFPDWLQVEFNGNKSISEIDIFGLQDDYLNSTAPAPTMTSTLWGNTDFEVLYWTGSGWATVPNGIVTGNNLIWRQFTFSPIITNKIRVKINVALNGRSRIVELEAWTAPTVPTNYALAANGASATASSTTPNEPYPGYNFNPSVTIDGDPKNGYNFWRDDTNDFPDSLEISFSGIKNISEIDLFSLQDDYLNSEDPTQTMTFSVWGVTDFEVQYWNGSSWVAVPGGNITGNNLVWRRLSFSPISTSKVKVTVTGALNGRSRIVELEAWGS